MREDENNALSLASFMLTSARGLLDEPKSYGTVRLLETLSRFIEFLKANGINEPFLESIRPEVEELKRLVLQKHEEIKDDLDSLIIKFTDELIRRGAT